MGIESDQLVFDYLSRVGDLAQQRQLPSGDRMRLVSSLRGEIDRRRATFGRESPAAIRGMLDELGSPDEVVDRATGTAPVPESAPGAAGGPSGSGGPGGPGVPRDAGAAPGGPGDPRAPGGPGGRKGAGARTVRDATGAPDVPGQRRGGRLWRKAPVPKPRTPAPVTGPTPPHLAGTDEVGAADTVSDWWRLDDAVDEPLPGDDLVPGFRGGVEIPELLRPPVREDEEAEEAEGDGPDAEGAPGEGAARRPLWRRVLRRGGGEPAAVEGGFRLGSPVLVLAALLLVGGAIFSSLLALALGWLLAYASRRLSRTEAQWAVVVLPALAATAGVVWIWGRVQGRWGEPVAAGGEAMGAAISEAWPWALKGAALASAAFLLWRARRAR